MLALTYAMKNVDYMWLNSLRQCDSWVYLHTKIHILWNES